MEVFCLKHVEVEFFRWKHRISHENVKTVDVFLWEYEEIEVFPLKDRETRRFSNHYHHFYASCEHCLHMGGAAPPPTPPLFLLSCAKRAAKPSGGVWGGGAAPTPTPPRFYQAVPLQSVLYESC